KSKPASGSHLRFTRRRKSHCGSQSQNKKPIWGVTGGPACVTRQRRRTMFLLYGVHYPRQGNEGRVVLAMHQFGELVKQQPGVLFADTFKNPKDGTLISLAIWESQHAFQASWPELVKRAPSQEWEIKPREVLMMESV